MSKIGLTHANSAKGGNGVRRGKARIAPKEQERRECTLRQSGCLADSCKLSAISYQEK
jgi:hypothetical protein